MFFWPLRAVLDTPTTAETGVIGLDISLQSLLPFIIQSSLLSLTSLIGYVLWTKG